MTLESARLGLDARIFSAAANSPPMRRGEIGSAVRLLQMALADLGARLPGSFRNGDFDGIFGRETEGAVREFQAAHGLATDGVAGRQTFTALDGIFTREDPFFSIPEVAQAELVVRMAGPPEVRPFTCLSGR